jgi:hypothetical protein
MNIQTNLTPDENPDLPIVFKMLMKNPPKPKSETFFLLLKIAKRNLGFGPEIHSLALGLKNPWKFRVLEP